MPTQNYNLYTAKGYAGEVQDSGPRVQQTFRAATDIGFGAAVHSSATGDVSVGGGANDNLYGIAVREWNHEADNRPSDGTTSYKVADAVSTLQEGYIYVLATTALTANTSPWVDDATGTFHGTTAAGRSQKLNATVLEDAQAGEVARIRLDIVHS